MLTHYFSYLLEYISLHRKITFNINKIGTTGINIERLKKGKDIN